MLSGTNNEDDRGRLTLVVFQGRLAPETNHRLDGKLHETSDRGRGDLDCPCVIPRDYQQKEKRERVGCISFSPRMAW